MATFPALLEELTDRAPIVCFAKDVEGRYLFVNDLGCKLFRLNRDTLIGKTDHEVFPAEVADAFVRDDKAALQSKTMIEIVERLVLPTGEVRIAHTTKFPVFRDGKLYGIGAFSFDVTDRERGAAELKESEHRYRSVVEHSPAAFVAFDPQLGRFAFANDRAAQMFEMSLEELLTKSPADVSPVLQPNGRTSEELAKEHVIAALSGGRRVFDWMHQTATGEPLPCHIWIDGIEESGRKLARAFIVDLREISAARRELDRQASLLAQTQALALIGGWEFTPETRTFRGSGEAARRFGETVTLDQILARLASTSKSQLEAAFGQKEAFDLELEVDVTSDARIVRLVGEAAKTGLPRSGWLQDVSRQRTLEARLRQSSKMDAVGRLAGGVAHDFNNMLGAILSAAGSLDQHLPMASADVREAIETITKASQQAAALTKQLLAFSRQQPSTREPVSLDALVADAIQILERTLDRRITLEHTKAPSAPHVDADVASLKNVLINLGINSRDAMPSGGRLSFETKVVTLDEGQARALDLNLSPGTWVSLVVRDTGLGIAPELLQRVFEPFFTTKEFGKGTGLGLATAYAAMREHQGALTVESKVSGGTCFTLWLKPSATKVAGAIAPQPTATARRGVILLTDDERLVRRASGRFLETLGFTVLPAADGTEAEAVLVKAGRVDLVMLDLVMPGRSAEDTLHALRAVQPDVPVLLCSGYAPEQVATRLLALPNVGRLQKPWSQRELDAALEQLLP